ncbi:MAG: hypothetical protein J7621_15895 [Niastella sp.]|nr:hypothetical protein [Niastella sp.]
MPIDEIKKQLVDLIENTNDEELLSLMKEDFSFYAATNETDITDELTEKQFHELKALSEEPADKDAMSVDDFKKATQQWRTK